MDKRSVLMIVGVIVLVSVGTVYRAMTREEADPTQTEDVASKPDAYRQPTAEEAEAFALELQRSIEQGDEAFLTDHFDEELLVERALGDRSLSPDAIKAGNGVTEGLGSQLVAFVAQGGSYQLLRISVTDQDRRALFRMLGAEGGLNYQDIILVVKDGQVVVADIYVFATGELLSEALRRAILPIIVQNEKSFLEKLASGESDYLKSVPQIVRMMEAKDPKQALAIYRQLPPPVQRMKNVMFIRFKAASMIGVDSPEYAQALKDMNALFRADPSLELMLVDYYLMQEDYDKAHETLERLRTSTGDNGYVETLHGNIYVAAGQPIEAEAAFRRAIEGEPSLEHPYWGMVNVALSTENWAAVSEWLTRIESDLDVELADLEELEDYAGYVQSDEYKKWNATR